MFYRADRRGDPTPNDTRPLDRNAKTRVMVYARALMRPTEKGSAYGLVTAKALAVLEALLRGFHNAHSDLCFPSYATIGAISIREFRPPP
jgi:hypothetical protein